MIACKSPALTVRQATGKVAAEGLIGTPTRCERVSRHRKRRRRPEGQPTRVSRRGPGVVQAWLTLARPPQGSSERNATFIRADSVRSLGGPLVELDRRSVGNAPTRHVPDALK